MIGGTKVNRVAPFLTVKDESNSLGDSNHIPSRCTRELAHMATSSGLNSKSSHGIGSPCA